MRLAHNLAANIGGAAVTLAAGVVFLPFYLVLLGPEAYGLIGFHAAMTGIVAAFDTTFGQLANRMFSGLRIEVPAAGSGTALFAAGEQFALGGAFLTFVLISALAGPLAVGYFNSQFLLASEIQATILLGGTALAFRWLISYYTSVLSGLEKQVGINLVLAVTTLCQFGGGLLLTKVLAPTVLIYFSLMVFVQGVSSLVLRRLVTRQLPPGPSSSLGSARTQFIENRGLATQMLAITLLGAVISQADKFILGAVADLKTLGLYTFCATVASLVLKIAGPVFAAVYPRLTFLAAQSGSDTELRRHYHLACQTVALMVFPASGVLIFLSPELMAVWVDSKLMTESVWPLLPLLAIGNMLNAMAQIPYAIQLAHGWLRLALWQNVIVTLCFLPGTYALALAFGGVGVAFSWVVVNAIYCFVGVALLHRRLLQGEFFVWLKKDLWIPFFFACPIPIVATSIDVSAWSRWELFALLISVGLLAMLGTLWGTRDLRIAVLDRFFHGA